MDRPIYLLVTFFFCSCAIRVGAQPIAWEPTAGPEGGTASRIVAVPNGPAYVVVAGHLHRSDDGGFSWTELPHPFASPQPEFARLVVTAGGMILAASSVVCTSGCYQSGIVRSTDEGTTWEPMIVGTSPEDTLHRLVWLGGERVVAQTGTGLFVTDDAGRTWTPFTPPVPDGARRSVMAGHPDGRLAVTARSDADSDTGWMLLSDDAGKTWTTTPTTFPSEPVGSWGLLAVTGGGTLIGYGVNEATAWRSENGGSSWEPVTVGDGELLKIETAAEPEGADELYAASRDGAYVSTDDGVTWASLGLDSLTVQAFARVGGDLLAATTDAVQRRPSGGTDWTRSSTGLQRMFMSRLAAAPDGTIYGAEFLGPIITRSDDGGDTWDRIGWFKFANALAVAPSGAVYLAARTLGVAPLWRSDDRGETWTPLPVPLAPKSSVVALHATPTGTVLAGHRGLHRSADDGETWTTVLEEDDLAIAVTSDPIDGTVYTGTGDGVLRSTDDGATWEAIGPNEATVTAMWAEGGVLLAGVLGFNFNPSGIMRSSDGGFTWESVLVTGCCGVNSIVSIGSEILAANSSSAPGNRVFRSSDRGLSWESFEVGLPGDPFPSFVSDLTVAGGRLFAATSAHSVYRTSAPFVALEDEANPKATGLAVYPNPASGAATGALWLDAAQSVRVGVYDLLGREVAVLYNGPLRAGDHRFTLDAGGYSGGLYVVRVAADGFSTAQRVFVVR